VISVARENPKARIALVGPTTSDARDVMVKGESGILEKSPPGFKPLYEPSKRLLTWPHGAQAWTYSAEEPRRIRGPQFTHAWCDEISTWQYDEEAWNMLRFALRLGGVPPRTIVTTTPQPTPLIRGFVKDASDPKSGIIITRGKTHDNRANLAPSFIESLERAFAGTRLYRQEMLGEVLSDIQGALWTQDEIHKHRVAAHPPLRRVVVAVDPAVSTHEDSDLTGIVVVGLGVDGHAYVLADRSGVYSPLEWATVVAKAYDEFRANIVVAERNQGGDLVAANIKTVARFIPVKTIHAAKGKFARAEPIAALAQQGRIHHVGVLRELEDELTGYSPITARKSPDRLDALVYALTELMLGEQVFRSPGSFVV
jgi:phage terminase large subunit-like protein